MGQFTDTEGRIWTLAVDVNIVRRVRNALGENLLDLAGGELCKRVTRDPVLLVDLMYEVVRPEAESQDVSPEAFGRALTGDVIDAATTALLESVADFFPSRKATVLRRMIEKGAEIDAKVVARAERVLEDGTLDAEIERLASKPGRPSTTSPAPSASTPAP